ncbi:cobalamin-dependent protein [Rhodococcus pseudokoreensis]|uniref:Cobalamin-dependent protein n=1 Tax=Rhodococcus pseudokoreensis TaxID=2811421 RepID=A0A974W7G0_9NOCA|nr:cobalamin-dependent protein [Rhodococcus pseudokoreensis]QSE92102.1 cobalamin-dependent protein [Rhodococcus pseudokoreensis]
MLAMLGVDVHSKGLRTLARLLRDRGVEVIYLGEHNTAAGLVQAMITEDPDVVGLSFSTSTYLHQVTALMAEMKRVDVADIPVMVGGLIHPDDEPALKELGVSAIFGPGSTIDAIVDFLESSRR